MTTQAATPAVTNNAGSTTPVSTPAATPANAPSSLTMPTNPYASASLYVGDLAPDVNESMLYEIFSVVGNVVSVRVCRDALTRRSLGYAYVNFAEVQAAERALDTLNFSIVRDRQIRIMWSHRDPALRKSGSGNVYVKNLDKSIDSKTLYDTFSVFGNILSCKVVTNSRGDSLGYGFVHFETDEAAKNAITMVDGKMIADHVVSVQPFKPKKEREGGAKQSFTNVFVKNLPATITEDSLRELFGKYGSITSVFLPMDEKTNRPRGFGFVNFDGHEQALAAVENLHEHDFEGQKLYVARAQKKSERERELRSRFEQMRLERQNKFAANNLYVKNLADDMTTEKLIEEFKKFGQITSARVMNDSTGRSRGFGFVCFTSSEEATKAVTEMNGKMIDNKPLYVALAQPREVRRAALEARFNNRMKMPYMQPGMYPPQAPFFFPQGMPQRMMFPGVPQRGMPGRWPQGPQGRGNAQMMNVPYNYPMMPQQGGAQRAPQRGRGQRGPQKNMRMNGSGPQGRGRASMANPQGIAYTMQARNKPQAGAAAGGAPMGVIPAAGMASVAASQPLTIQELAALTEEQQKKVIGERLFPLIHAREPVLAPKVTGMLLGMDNGELLHLLESSEALGERVQEALQVLQDSQQQEQDQGSNGDNESS